MLYEVITGVASRQRLGITQIKWGFKMMKRLVMLFLLSGLLVTNSAWAITFTFSDKDFLDGASWGTLEIVAIDSDTLQVTYTASSASIIPAGSAVAGFAFLVNSRNNFV